MAGGLAALLDDIAALAKLAAASIDDVGAAAGRASAKAAGVVIDDTAVTPRYVQGLAAERELPIIKKIAIGSLRNKLIFILPAIMLLSQFLPWALTPLLMIGGAYLCFEGAEKLWEHFGGHQSTAEDEAGDKDEDAVVAGAIRTDFILSAEIMVISLKEVASEAFWSRLIILVVVAVVITVAVYGVVALIVKMDDVGLALSQKDAAASQKLGRGLVRAMPVVLSTLSWVGIVAMLWVGGHILLQGTYDLGWKPLYEMVHHWEEAVGGGFVGWLVNTGASAVAGALVGAVIVAVMHVVHARTGGHDDAHSTAASDTPAAH